MTVDDEPNELRTEDGKDHFLFKLRRMLSVKDDPYCHWMDDGVRIAIVPDSNQFKALLSTNDIKNKDAFQRSMSKYDLFLWGVFSRAEPTKVCMHKSGGDERGLIPKSIGDLHRDIDDESLLNLAGRYHEEKIVQKILQKIIVPSPHARSTRTVDPLEARVQRLERTVRIKQRSRILSVRPL